MDILFLLVPLSVLLALAVLCILAWAVWSGQFEELDNEAKAILQEMPAAEVSPSGAIPTSLIHINTAAKGRSHTQA